VNRPRRFLSSRTITGDNILLEDLSEERLSMYEMDRIGRRSRTARRPRRSSLPPRRVEGVRRGGARARIGPPRAVLDGGRGAVHERPDHQRRQAPASPGGGRMIGPPPPPRSSYRVRVSLEKRRRISGGVFGADSAYVSRSSPLCAAILRIKLSNFLDICATPAARGR
jgi:hypothetical protein